MTKLGQATDVGLAAGSRLTLEALARRCPRCEAMKPVGEFPARQLSNARRKLDSYCRPCRKTYQHEWYLANRDRLLAAAAARRDRARAKLPPRAPVPDRRPLREAVGFRTHPNSRVQGDAGLGIAIAYFSRIGFRVAIPLTDSQRYDLIVDDGEQLQRVQVKTTSLREPRYGGYLVRLGSVGRNTTRVVTRMFDPLDYEWLFVVCGDACAYLIPTDAIDARSQLYLGPKYEAYRLTD